MNTFHGLRTCDTIVSTRKLKILPKGVQELEKMMEAQATEAPKVYVVMASNPLEQGHANVMAGVFLDEEIADEAAQKWSWESEDREKELHGDRWRSFAVSFYVETVTPITSVEDIPSADTVYP